MKYNKLINFFIGLFILLILIPLMLLIVQNRKLKGQIVLLRKEIPHLIVNNYAPPIAVIEEREFLYFHNNSKKTLLIIFSTFCTNCDKNLTFWKRLDHQLKEKVQIIAVVSKGVEQAQTLKVNFPIYVPEDINGFINDYKVSNSSQTILINKEGEIEWIKVGELNSDDYLKIKELALKLNFK